MTVFQKIAKNNAQTLSRNFVQFVFLPVKLGQIWLFILEIKPKKLYNIRKEQGENLSF
jgi:hypothetical protein